MLRFIQVFYAIFSGLLLALAIPNELLRLGSPALGFLCIIPLYMAVASAKSYNESFWYCAIQALTAHLASSFWLGNFHGYAVFTLGASAFGTAGYHGFFGWLYFWLYEKLRPKRMEIAAGRLSFAVPLKILWFASLYTVWEWCKSNGFLGYPWGTVSMTAYTMPVITQIADITGCYGVTFLFTFVSSTLGEAILLLEALSHTMTPRLLVQSWKQTAKAVTALGALALCYGCIQLVLPRKPVKTLNAALVQQNHDPWQGGDAQTISLSEKLTEDALKDFAERDITPDVVVWSEAVLSKRFPTATAYYENVPEDKPLLSFIREKALPFIIGAPLILNAKKNQYGNSTVLFDKKGTLAGAYVKLHLVPFAERIPGVEYEWVRKLMKSAIGFSYGWTQGYKAVLFDIPIKTPPHYDAQKTQIVSLLPSAGKKPAQQTVLVGTPICFDDAFGEVCRRLYLAGSEVFINLTNDAWSRTDSAELQHFVVASYRAIEYRTTLARSTNAGFTCVISPTGAVLQSLPLFKAKALAASIPVYERKMTIYARFGDWLPKTLALLAAALVGAALLFEQKERTAVTTERTALLAVDFRIRADYAEWNY